jgi:phosphoglucomutase
MALHPLAGKPASAAPLIDVAQVRAAYADATPDASVPEQRVAFGTSGHRGTAAARSFNAAHVFAITQAICDYRRAHGIDGPLYLGGDTHTLSQPAFDSALEVLAANGVDTLASKDDEFTPTPALSRAIVAHNRGRTEHSADGIVITPSHNPPDNGGFKYNPTHGGPADTDVTRWIENQANGYLERKLAGVKRLPLAQARAAATTHAFDFLASYVDDLSGVVDFDKIRGAGIRMGVDPLGGAGVNYWPRIAERYRVNLEIVDATVDAQFAFMSLDWDGRIRMDPSSAHAMQRLIGLKDRYDVAFACDTDHDRHGIVAPSVGLMPSNHYLCVLAYTLFQVRSAWPGDAALAKTVVSTGLLDRIAAKLGRPLFEAPVGFKWFAPGLLAGRIGFACEESAGASVLRRDGTAWTTDKDGIVPALLAAELMAHSGRDPGEMYRALTAELGEPHSDRVQGLANAAQRKALGSLRASELELDTLAGERVLATLDRAPGNGAPIGGVRVNAENGWFAARPSGTEDIYKIYGESFRDRAHLDALLSEAQRVVDAALRDVHA